MGEALLFSYFLIVIIEIMIYHAKIILTNLAKITIKQN